MAGANKVLKPGQILFKAGDPGDGMYLIRKGELQVFLEKDGKEVTLASIPNGSVIGEMSLFDQKPRSASAKATQETEVTLISLDDFGKLMKQIPKWFVTLMQALSGRLRTTNERLQALEAQKGGAPGAGAAAPARTSPPFQSVLRQINIINLLWHKDGVKDGKEWTLEKAIVTNMLVTMLGEDKEAVNSMLNTLVTSKVLISKQNSYNSAVLSMPNRAILEKFAQFMADCMKANPQQPSLPDTCIAMLGIISKIVQASAYDTATVSFADLDVEGKRAGLETGDWKANLAPFKTGGEAVKLVKVSDSDVGFRTTKKELEVYVLYHTAMNALHKAKLS